ncbi:vWA domain-containing protein [Hydrogenimonas cancrithermarum]|uniref:Hydrolase n=1 Tax=Hydrogenimonas cancrithermarum TaxID=2993563 RepID=A0ABN6WXC1_9BACT|nr:VWA-like domain-containing protein [Hydrogenimonas cancrithermarum]BDY13268.1 hydrolase [Hydrogenimonas cancrithermarum]
MSVETEITKAKTRLMVKHPYFGLLASRLKTEPSDEVETFLSDGRVLQYNPDYFDDEGLETIEFALANSVMHHVLAHENRRLLRQGWLWQLATDYAINDMLKRNGFKLPARVHYDDRFEGMYAEAIYAQLKDEIQNEDYNDDESNEEGFNEQNKNRMTEQQPPEDSKKRDDNLPLPPQELEPELEEQWAQAMKEALEKAQNQGSDPGGIERLFTITSDTTVDWRSELYQAINRHLKNDYTFAKPSKKMIARGVYLPSTTSDRLIVTVAIDSSGSVNEALLGLFVGELEALLMSFPGAEVDVLICDAKIQGVYRFVSGEILEFAMKGGGGTDFRPVFDYIEEELSGTSLLIYFTDAEGTFPDEAPFYDTIWVLPEERSVPFGRTIVLEV